MNFLKRFAAAALVLCLALSLCACGSSDKNPVETTEAAPVETQPVIETTEATEAPVDDGKVTYTVIVVDEAGSPIPGVMVQWCLDTCFPGLTDASGVAQYTDVEADYHVTVSMMPAGYTYSTEQQEFNYEAGSTELTITLKAEG